MQTVLNLEKQNGINKTLSYIKVNDKEVHGVKNVLKEQKLFYEQLYDEGNKIDEKNLQYFLNDNEGPKLSNDEKLCLENLLSEEEISKTLI